MKEKKLTSGSKQSYFIKKKTEQVELRGGKTLHLMMFQSGSPTLLEASVQTSCFKGNAPQSETPPTTRSPA